MTSAKPTPFVEIEVGGQQLRCEYDYSPWTPGVHTLRNGDPGYPDEPEEFAVTRVLLFVGPTPLNPNAWLDVSDLVAEIAGGDADSPVETLAREALELELIDQATPDPEVTDWGDLPEEYLTDQAADRYERDLDARASQ